MKTINKFNNLTISEARALQQNEAREGNPYRIQGNSYEGFYLIPEGLTYSPSLFTLFNKSSK